MTISNNRVVTAGVDREGIMVTLDMSIEDVSRRMQNTLRLAACSDLRRRILVSLRAGKKPLSGFTRGAEGKFHNRYTRIKRT